MTSLPDLCLVPNGVDDATGAYLRPRVSVPEIARAARECRLRRPVGVRGLARGIDPRDLAQTGWGVIFAEGAAEEKQLLEELLRLRRQQAGWRYRELYYRPGEGKLAFAAHHGQGPGPVDGERVPYYLLIVGGPETIPFSFQHQLAVSYAVGRISFATPQEYSRYARHVVANELRRAAAAKDREREGKRPPRMVVFGTRHPDDEATRLSVEELALPLAATLRRRELGWTVEEWTGADASKRHLARLLGGGDTPDLLFTSGHGLFCRAGAPHQPRRQGALLCDGWPGPRAGRGQGIADEVVFTGDDLAADACLDGLVSFHFACFSAGTPELDSFSRLRREERKVVAPRPFVAHLPQRLLAAGAQAVVGHVDTAWQCSFSWPGAGSQIGVFAATLQDLMRGYPVGDAMRYFGERYAEIATECHDEETAEYADLDIALLWLANNDAKSYTLLGDPAVRLRGRPE